MFVSVPARNEQIVCSILQSRGRGRGTYKICYGWKQASCYNCVVLFLTWLHVIELLVCFSHHSSLLQMKLCVIIFLLIKKGSFSAEATFVRWESVPSVFVWTSWVSGGRFTPDNLSWRAAPSVHTSVFLCCVAWMWWPSTVDATLCVDLLWVRCRHLKPLPVFHFLTPFPSLDPPSLLIL